MTVYADTLRRPGLTRGEHDMPSIEVGNRATGWCVTMNIQYTGTVAEVIAPVRHSGHSVPLYRLVDTGQCYSSGRPIEPIVERASRAKPLGGRRVEPERDAFAA
jgi:hypothetical protein